MTKHDDIPANPLLGETAQARAAAREARRATALRANLTRRKTQTRARQDDTACDPAASGTDGGGGGGGRA